MTKATSQSSLGQEIVTQFTTNPRPLMIGRSSCWLPWRCAGLAQAAVRRCWPALLCRPVAATGVTAGQAESARGRRVPANRAAAKPAAESPLDDFLQADRACVEIGARLIPLVDPKRGTGLLDRIGGLRRDLASKNGLWVPPIRVRDNIQLDADAYRILIGGREVARGPLRPDRWLAIDPGGTRVCRSTAKHARDPAFGLPGQVDRRERPPARRAGRLHRRRCPERPHHASGRNRPRGTPTSCSAARISRCLVDKVRETSPSRGR